MTSTYLLSPPFKLSPKVRITNSSSRELYQSRNDLAGDFFQLFIRYNACGDRDSDPPLTNSAVLYISRLPVGFPAGMITKSTFYSYLNILFPSE